MGISGAELAARAFDQAILFGTEMIYGHAAAGLRVDGTDVPAQAVVIAFAHRYQATSRARGGTIVMCAATSGFPVECDNRHLWMKLKTIKGSRFANYGEAWDANRLIAKGKINPVLSVIYPLDETGEAAW